jgi:DNA-binding MarR family transcriptional regulator
MITRLIIRRVTDSRLSVPPEDDLLVLLTDAARVVRTLADRRARAHGMTRAQWLILIRLRKRDGLTQRELAENLEVEPITVGRLVDRLAARALVERRADPADRRVWRLHLTAAAGPVLAEIDAVRRTFDAEATKGLSAEERAVAARVIARMKANLLAAETSNDDAAA